VADRNGLGSSPGGNGFPARHAAALANARGAIAAISSCGEAGLLSAEAVGRLNLVAQYRIELMLHAAGSIWQAAHAAQALTVAFEEHRRNGAGAPAGAADAASSAPLSR
jgi:hypothetical protein